MKLTEKEIKAIEKMFWRENGSYMDIASALFGSVVRHIISWEQSEGLLNVKACKLFAGIYHEDDAVKGMKYMQVERPTIYHVDRASTNDLWITTRGSNNG